MKASSSQMIVFGKYLCLIVVDDMPPVSARNDVRFSKFPQIRSIHLYFSFVSCLSQNVTMATYASFILVTAAPDARS